ncbi:MAG: hypothetical protein EA398_06710 [Deltaproteobacteria bacterium]|nr:MAG: hypothetical protein EA398_06710 [Deltaproteobacteria bacterium]
MQKCSRDTTGVVGSATTSSGLSANARRGMILAAVLALFALHPLAMRVVVVPLVEARGAALGIEVDVAGVRMGWPLDIVVSGVELRPGDEANRRMVPAVHVPEVRLRWAPHRSLSAVRSGLSWREGLALRLDAPEVVLSVDVVSGGDLAWFRSRRELAVAASPGGGDDQARTAAGALDRWPEVRVQGGFVTLDDPSGLLPAVGIRIEELWLAPPSRPPRRFASGSPPVARRDVTGMVRVEGLGRALLRGRLGDGDDRSLEVRLVQDNDLALLLPARWRPPASADLMLGAVRFEAPADLVVQPVRGRSLGLAPAGPTGGVIDAVWLHELRFGVRPHGLEVLVTEARVRALGPAGPAGAQPARLMRIPEVRLVTPWDEGGGTLAFGILDEFDRLLEGTVTFDEAHEPTQVELLAGHVSLESFSPLLHLPGGIRIEGGLLDGALAWQRSDGAWWASARGLLLDGRLHAPPLAPGPLSDVRLEWSGRILGEDAGGRVSAEDAWVVVGEIPIRLGFGRETMETGTRWTATMELAPVEAERVRRSLPIGFAERLQAMRFEGTVGVNASLDVAPGTDEPATFDVQVLDEDLRVVDFGPLTAPSHFAGPFEARMVSAAGEPLRLDATGSSWFSLGGSEWPRLARIVMAAEDDRFLMHEGFDVRALGAAIKANLEAGSVVRGGSTISQQVVKNLYTDSRRTLDRKIEELLLTRELEAALSKTRILEIYLNMAHLGPGVHGVEDAARMWFGRSAPELALLEGTFLAAILPAPERFGRAYAAGELPECRWEKMRNILHNLHRAGVIDDDAHRAARHQLRQRRISRHPPPSPAALDGRASAPPSARPL